MASVSSVRAKSRQPLFVSAKTAIPVVAGSRARIEALAQATLDPGVSRIEFVPTAVVSGVEVPLNGIVLVGTDGRRRLLDLPEARHVPDLDEEGLVLLAAERLGLEILTLHAKDLNEDPKAANCRLVWACHDEHASAGDRVRILHHLEECGPSRLVDIASLVRSSADGVPAVLALACQDLLELDLVSAPLGPSTMVRKRRQPDGG
jgi:hypothetical protein